MKTEKAGYGTTEYPEHTEMNSMKSQAFTEANEDNKGGKSSAQSFVNFVCFCSNPHPCIPCSPASRAALMLFWLIPWLRNIPISAPDPSLCSLRSLWLNFVPPPSPFRIFRVFRGLRSCSVPLRFSVVKTHPWFKEILLCVPLRKPPRPLR